MSSKAEATYHGSMTGRMLARSSQITEDADVCLSVEVRPNKIPGVSPGYWRGGLWGTGWVFTGCSRHDLDPCSVCDAE